MDGGGPARATCQHRAVPVLGSIPSPSFNGIQVGPFDIRIYGLCYVLAVLAAVAITTRRWEAQGGSRELVQDVALWGFPAGIVGGRLYFLATSWNGTSVRASPRTGADAEEGPATLGPP